MEYKGARSSLAVYLALALADALDDLHRLGLDTGGVHARFLGWLRARGGPLASAEGHDRGKPQTQA